MNVLSDDTFEAFLGYVSGRDCIDLSSVGFIDPYGMLGVLEAGRYLESNSGRRPLLLPESDNVLRYLERMDFFKYADRYFTIVNKRTVSDKFFRSSYSDVLLEITPIQKSDDIHFIVGKVKKRSHAILKKHLHYNENAIHGFIVALSEVCQNIIEHSKNTGFVGIQKYRFQKLKKNVVKIAVMDLGIGFMKSLAERILIKDDLVAIESALMHGMSRYEDRGRGHGLAGVKRFVSQWNGKLSIRSGSAKLSVIPDWGWGREKEKGLSYFPGSQINILLPEV